MAVSKEIVALELALQKVVNYEQMSKKSALIVFFLELNSLFSLLEAQIKLGAARFQLLPYLEKLHTHPLVKNNIPLIAEQLKTYPELLKFINQSAIDLKTKLQQELSVPDRPGSAIRDALSKQTQLDIEYLAFFSSLLPIFHAPNEVQGIIDKRINFLFAIAQYVPEVLVALVQTTKLRLYHGNLFNYLLGSYFFTSFSDSILFKMELELLPPIAELAHLEQNLEDLVSCYEAIKRFSYEQLSLVGAASIGYGAVSNNYPALPLVNQKLVDHIKEQIKTLKGKNPSIEQLELLNTLAKQLEHYRKWPELFASFSQNLQDILIKLRTRVLNLDYETIAYKLITVYQCDPQPPLLAKLVSSLLEHIKASSDKKIQAGLSTVLATVYRLMQTQKIKILAASTPNLSELVQDELDSEAAHTAAMKSYTFAPSLPPLPLLTKEKVFTATKKQVAMVSAYLQYFYDHQEECPAHDYYEAFINWLSKVNLKQELDSSHLFEMVHLLYTLNFTQYNEDYAQQISALLVHQLEQTKNKQNKLYLLTMMHVLKGGAESSEKDIRDVFSECQKRYQGLAYLSYDYFEREKGFLTTLAPIWPHYSPIPNDTSLQAMSYGLSDPSLFSVLTSRGSRVCPIANDLGQQDLVVKELLSTSLQLLGRVDSVLVAGRECTYHRLKSYWNTITEYLSTIKSKAELQTMKEGVFKKLPLALWAELVEKDLPDNSSQLFKELTSFLSQQGELKNIIDTAITEIYDELFNKKNALLEQNKEKLLDLISFFVSINLELSPQQAVALERLNKLRAVYGKARVDEMFALHETGQSALLVRQKSSSASLLNTVASGSEPKPIHHRTLTFFAGQFDSAPVSLKPPPAMVEEISAKAKLMQKKSGDSQVLAKKVSPESPFSEAVLLAEKFRLMRESRAQKSQDILPDKSLILSGSQPK